jgi:hypothetical protein
MNFWQARAEGKTGAKISQKNNQLPVDKMLVCFK